MHKFFSMHLFLFITLYKFRAHLAHHQERQILSIQQLVNSHSMLVAEMCAGWKKFQPAHISATNIELLLLEAVLIQFVSPDDEHDVLETCREL